MLDQQIKIQIKSLIYKIRSTDQQIKGVIHQRVVFH